MARKIPQHHLISKGEPDGFDRPSGPQPTLNVKVHLDGPDIKFETTPVDIPEYPAQGDDIAFYIACDCLVNVEIVGADWKLSETSAVFTTKEPFREYYGNLKVHSLNKFSFFAKMSDEEMGGTPAARHGFNLNLAKKQSNGKYLPISIDPDIGNPKPPNGGKWAGSAPVQSIPAGLDH